MSDQPRATAELPAIKGGNLFIESISMGDEFAPGDQISVQVVVGNGALVINPISDEDACRHSESRCEPPGIHEPIGYCTRVGIAPSWAQAEAFRQCIPLSTIGVPSETFGFSLTAPDAPGKHDVTINLVADGSGERASTTRTITVTGDGGGDGNGEPPPDEEGIPTEWLVMGGGIIAGLGLLAIARRGRQRSVAPPPPPPPPPPPRRSSRRPRSETY